MEIFLISQTTVDWEIFITKCNKFLGRSPTRNLDSKGLPTGSLNSYLSILSAFWQKDSNPQVINDFTLEHITLTFMIMLNEFMYYELLEKTQGRLKFIKCEDFNPRGEVTIITTGTLFNWKHCIINIDVQEFCLKMWQEFQKRGFSIIFQEYKINENQIIEKRK